MTDACITIESSDEDDVQIMDPSVVQTEPKSSEEVKRKIALQTVETGKSVFTTLLSTCKNADSSSEMDIIVNKMWKRFHEADSLYTSSAAFIEVVKTAITQAAEGPFCQLKSVSDDLRFHKIKATSSTVASDVLDASSSTNSKDADPKTRRTIRKLEKLYSKLQRKIDYLEKQEVDLADSSDEQNSAYVQVCRYKTRICEVFKKLCQLRKTDADHNSLLRNIKFSGSKIPAVNRAIERFYNETREFPDFIQVLTIVRKANDLKKLGLSSEQCYKTAEEAFKEFGETLKRQRQIDLSEDLKIYLESSDGDPASKNQFLEEKLQENNKLYGGRIDEIIDKYAKRQVEEKLEPEDVPDDAASVSGEEDEDEQEEEASSIAEVESNADDSSADENDAGMNDGDVDADAEKSFEVRDVSIVLPDLLQTPEWAAYHKAKSARHSATGCAGAVCQPVPGCSKDVVDDFCDPCAYKTPFAPKRSHAVISSGGADDDGVESCAKVAKVDGSLISVDLTNDSQPTEPATQVVESMPTVSLNDEDPLGNVKASCSQMPNGIADESTVTLASGSESAKSQPFVVVDVETILAKKPGKHLKFKKFKPQNGSKVVGELLSSKTESLVTHEDAVGDDVPVSNSGLKDRLKTLTKNGIKIVNVSSKNDSSSTLPVNNGSRASTNLAKDKSEVEMKNESSGPKKTNCEIIDLEETGKTVSNIAAQFTKSFPAEPTNSTNLFSKAAPSNTNQNSKPSFFRSSSHREILKTPDSRMPWPKFSPGFSRFPATSTPKPSSIYHPRPSSVSEPQSQLPSSNSNFGSRFYPRSQRHPMSQPHFGGGFGASQNVKSGLPPPRPPNVFVGPAAAMTKRTVQTTQKFVKGNNIYTQTMTVVQEVQLQPGGGGVARGQFASNGPARFGGAPGSGSATQSRGSSSTPSGCVPQAPRQKMIRKKSADVITLE